MAPLVEGILALLMWLRRAGAIVILAWVVLILWLAARRAGRKGLELAVLLFTAALAMFTVAVFARRPPMSEMAAVVLVLLAALLVVVTAAVVLWLGVRRRKPPRVVKHTHPPWENGGW